MDTGGPRGLEPPYLPPPPLLRQPLFFLENTHLKPFLVFFSIYFLSLFQIIYSLVVDPGVQGGPESHLPPPPAQATPLFPRKPLIETIFTAF